MSKVPTRILNYVPYLWSIFNYAREIIFELFIIKNNKMIKVNKFSTSRVIDFFL